MKMKTKASMKIVALKVDVEAEVRLQGYAVCKDESMKINIEVVVVV